MGQSNRNNSGAATRALAALCVDAVVNHGRNLDAALAELELHSLAERDQALVKALAFGTVRTHLRNAALLQLLLKKRPKQKDRVVEALLSVGLFALQESERPDYAVVSATVAATAELDKPHLRGLVNAILRRFLREREQLLQEIAQLPEARTLLPAWLVEQLQQDWPEQFEEVIAAGNRQAPMWLRVNTQRQSAADYQQRLSAAGIAAAVPEPASAAVLLDQPVSVQQLPGFADGDCSVQDVASQQVAQMLAPESGHRVLDVCAAPGGKTAHLLEQYPGIELVAVDRSPRRLQRVTENLQRLGLEASAVAGDALEPDAWWDGKPFDRILVDAPCSAIGVLRRHPDIRLLRRPADSANFAEIQLAMLNSMWNLLAPGGQLLYTTCSIMRAENEQVVQRFLSGQSTARELSLTSAVEHLADAAALVEHGLQLLPGRLDNDGFYYALMERNKA